MRSQSEASAHAPRPGSALLPIVSIDHGGTSYPSGLLKYLGDKAPKRVAALGNIDLLRCKALALVCSVKCPGTLIVQTYDFAQGLREVGVPVIGGFHSPMERECLRILLRGKQPIVVCPGRSLHGMKLPKEYKDPLDQGRLLLLSPFSEKHRRPTMETAMYRNHFVAALADRIFVPYAAPSSKTFEFCRALVSWQKPLYTLASEANAELVALGAQPLENLSTVSSLAER